MNYSFCPRLASSDCWLSEREAVLKVSNERHFENTIQIDTGYTSALMAALCEQVLLNHCSAQVSIRWWPAILSWCTDGSPQATPCTVAQLSKPVYAKPVCVTPVYASIMCAKPASICPASICQLCVPLHSDHSLCTGQRRSSTSEPMLSNMCLVKQQYSVTEPRGTSGHRPPLPEGCGSSSPAGIAPPV